MLVFESAISGIAIFLQWGLKVSLRQSAKITGPGFYITYYKKTLKMLCAMVGRSLRYGHQKVLFTLSSKKKGIVYSLLRFFVFKFSIHN